jgi:ABC-type transport system substrate-binding protein
MNYGVKETGVFEGHSRFASSPRIQYSSVSFGESLVAIQQDLSPGPMLAADWDISEGGQFWTFKIRDDVAFHSKCGANADESCGNLTVHDVLWNYKEWHEGSLNARAGIIGDFWVGNAGGSQEIVDDYTVKLDTGEPWLQQRAFEFMRHLGGVSTTIVSMQQTREIFERAGNNWDDRYSEPGVATEEYEAAAKEASKNISATGPWEIIGPTNESSVWRFTAVNDHWRQTPYFAEFNIRSIPEEATRVAAFQTGELDIMEMAFDSLGTVQAVEGTEIVAWPNATQSGLNLYGQTYGLDKEGNPYEHFDCTKNAWASCNEDPTSQEWQDAVKVKKAMAIAINRQEIVDTLLAGFGEPLYLRDWMGFDHKADPRWVHEYDPDMARLLLEEAGYGPDNKFSITLTTAIRGRPAEVPACEAVGGYWQAVGIDVKFQRVPYATIRPELITRIYQGATCHATSQRLTPAIGASNYVAKSTFSYGTEHPWLEEKITDLLAETNPALVDEKEKEVFGWIYDNVMAFGLYTIHGIWPVGKRLDPEWRPVDFSELASPQGFEYIKHRE